MFERHSFAHCLQPSTKVRWFPSSKMRSLRRAGKEKGQLVINCFCVNQRTKANPLGMLSFSQRLELHWNMYVVVLCSACSFEALSGRFLGAFGFKSSCHDTTWSRRARLGLASTAGLAQLVAHHVDRPASLGLGAV